MNRLLSVAAFSALTFGFASCQSASEADKQAAAVAAHEKTIDSMKIELARQQVIDSMEDVAAMTRNDQAASAALMAAPLAQPQRATAVRKAPAVAKRRATTRRRSVSNNSYNRGATYSNAGYSTPAPVYAPAPAPAKRGWSAKAKGAVIGAGAGAVGGAIINKRNRAAGAIIGGVGGAAIGTGVGAIIDHKNGR